MSQRVLSSFAITLALAGVVPSYSVAQVLPLFGCTWSKRTIPVLMNEGDLAANGISPDDAERALRNAMEVVNSDSQANINLVWDGRTTSTALVPGKILVQFNNTFVCPGTALGWGNPNGCDGGGGGGVVLVLQDCMGNTHPWVNYLDPQRFRSG